MTRPDQGSYWVWWVLFGVVAACGLVAAGFYFTRGVPAVTVRDVAAPEPSGAGPRVEVVVPTKGEMDRTTSQPGSLRAFESVRLFAEASGYLKTLNVDIGDRVTRGQVLAEVAVPDLEKLVQQYQAALKQAHSRVAQMEAGIKSAKAELDAARAAVPQAEALARSKAHRLEFRQKQLKRYKDLLELQSIDERLVDESIEQRDDAREAEIAAREGVTSANAKVAAVDAKVTKAEADRDEAKAEVDVAQSLLEKAQVQVGFATIRAPFDGVVTERDYFRNDYVRAAGEGSTLPLLTVQRTDLFRVVVEVPDRDVPYVRPGNPATVEIDALPGEKFPATVARVSRSEDPQTRLMHVEIDLPNDKPGRIADGMYGRVSILLEKSNMLAVPSSCLVGKPQDGKGTVYVVRDGQAHAVPVRIGADNGLRVGIISGLPADDRVILHPGGGVEDGTAVTADEAGR